MMPASRARRAAPTRSGTASLPQIADTWLRMVFGLRCSVRAIWPFDAPPASRTRTSCSRSRQLGERARDRRRRGGEVEHVRDGRRAQHHLPPGDAAHGLDDVLALRLAAQEPEAAAGQHRDERRLGRLGGEDEDRRVGRRAGQPRHRLESAARVREVEDHHVGAEQPRRARGVAGVRGLAGRAQVARAVEQDAQAGAEDRLLRHDEDPQPRGHPRGPVPARHGRPQGHARSVPGGAGAHNAQRLPIFRRAVAQVGPVDIRPPAAVGSRGRPFDPWERAGTMATTTGSDEERLAEMGYKQELDRSWSGFQNFAISFTIISVLAGCFTTYYQAWNNGGPVAISWGWPIISAFILIIAFCMSELASAYPTAGGIYWWAAKLGGPGWGWITGWFNLLGLIAILASVDYFAGQFLSVVLGLYNVNVLGLNFGDTPTRSGRSSSSSRSS